LALKRGMWNYSCMDAALTPQTVSLENGVSMNLGETQQLINEKHDFLGKRLKMMQHFKEPEPKQDKKKAVAAKGGKAAPAKGKAAAAAPKKK